jgi:sucrose-6-phosphate hydrolase SacC (GH32 family)
MTGLSGKLALQKGVSVIDFGKDFYAGKDILI